MYYQLCWFASATVVIEQLLFSRILTVIAGTESYHNYNM